ncbi:hypothetical protein E5N72_00070 [Pseudoalteromonas sp. MEBiC 03607]|nr:hypothetical protein E5N72_00070 [Pseudoalteromonas sp. MEBiC 03607]
MRVASCELRVASCELRVASCELRVASCELRVNFKTLWCCHKVFYWVNLAMISVHYQSSEIA